MVPFFEIELLLRRIAVYRRLLVIMRETPLSDPVEQAKLYRQAALRLLGHWLFLILLVGAIGATWIFLVIAIIWACTLA